MSTLYICGKCLTQDQQERAVLDTPANNYVKVSNCPDCREGLDDSTISEVEVLSLLLSQDSYSYQVEREGAYAGTTLDLIKGIMALDPENDEEYNDHALVDMIETAIRYHRNHKDKADYILEYGYTVEGDGLICPKCADNPMYKGALERVDKEGYPDGYTCADCGEVVK